MNTKNEYIKNIAEKLNDIEYITINDRLLKESDIKKISNKQIIQIEHKKGFLIQIRKQYIIDMFLNIPTLLYSTDQYIVCDELLGKHGVEYNAKDMAEYVNGLLGY